MKYLGKYLKSLCDFTLTTQFPHFNPEIIVVIPVYDENESFIDTIESLKNQTGKIPSTLVLILLNYRSSDQDELKLRTLKFYEELNKSYCHTSNSEIRFEFFVEELDGKKAGVGLARKMLMDLAFRIFYKQDKNGIIVNLDADTLVEDNYLHAIAGFFKVNSSLEAASLAFEHPVGQLGSDDEQHAAATYELHLRYFINMQRLINLPFAYQTVGSAMAVKAWAYAKEGGMNKRQAGEDFYFLHKFSKNNKLGEINDTFVYPATRKSNRVPFGTGKAIIELTSGSEITGSSYNPDSFIILGLWIDLVFENYDQGLADLLPKNHLVSDFIISRNEESRLNEIRDNTSDKFAFQKRFFGWFNAFMLMKYLHYLRDISFPDQPILSCCTYLFEQLGLSYRGEVYYLLTQLREFDINNNYDGIRSNKYISS